MRLSVRYLSNRKHRNPEDIETRDKYHETLKAYNALLKTKKNDFLNGNIFQLDNSNISDNFWNNLKSFDDNLHETVVPPVSEEKCITISIQNLS